MTQITFNVSAWGIAVLVICFVWWPPENQPSSHRYVSQVGSDLWGNGSSQRPWRSIQYASDRARVGDVIHILSGIYRERIHLRNGGEVGNPVRLIADPPGSVLITGSCSPADCERATWEDEGNGIYSAEIGWPIHMMQADGKQLFRVPWGGVPGLRELTTRPDAHGAFCFENGRVFLGLASGQHPESARLAWHQHAPPPQEWGEFKSANIWVEADHIVVSGFRLEFGLGSAIRVWNACDFAVEDCEFSGCTHGVQAGVGIKPATELRVERCWYHNTPQSDWARSWLTWSEVYSAYSSSTLCASGDRPVKVCNNLVTDFGDALRISPSPSLAQEGSAELVGNWLAFGTDDGFELDGGGHRVLVHSNVVIDVHEGVSLSPVTDGPVSIKGNLFWSPKGGLNGSQLKFIPPESFRGESARITGVLLQDNLFCGEWLAWRADVSVNNVNLRHNLFSVDRQLTPPWPPGVNDEDNIYRLPRDPDRSNVITFLCGISNEAKDANLQRTIRDARKMLDTRPGPSWLEWDNHPSTARLLTLLGIR